MMGTLARGIVDASPAGEASKEDNPALGGLAIVAPFFNESACIPLFLERIEVLIGKMVEPPQVVFVDDGSKDGSADLLRELTRDWKRTSVVALPVNSGQAAALLAGLKFVETAMVATMDGDGQNDPGDIPAMLAFLEEKGADMVVGIRAARKDSALRRWMSRLANGVRGWILRDGVRDSGCALKVFRREVIGSFLPIKTLYSFMPAMAVAAGFAVTEMPVQHHPRVGGTSSYGFWRFLWRPFFDLMGMWWFVRRRIVPEARETVRP